jgi:hypothetical protein
MGDPIVMTLTNPAAGNLWVGRSSTREEPAPAHYRDPGDMPTAVVGAVPRGGEIVSAPVELEVAVPDADGP